MHTSSQTLEVFVRRAVKICIAMFCVWHMFAVFQYNLTGRQREQIGNMWNRWNTIISVEEDSKKNIEQAWLRVRYTVRRYILITSQWQRWNLFSPDPLRRVSEFVIDVEDNGQWKELYTVNHDTLAWHRQTSFIKALNGLFEDHKRVQRHQFMQAFCHLLDVDSSQTLRLRKRFYVIPKIQTVRSASWWAKWQPGWKEQPDIQYRCMQS